MKTEEIKITFTIIITVFYTSMMFSSCGNTENAPKKVEHEHNHEKSEEIHVQDHMLHMNETRDWLKQELGDKYNEPISPATKEQLTQGKELFTINCVACHGVSGKGDGQAAVTLNPKPADFTDKDHSSFYSDQGRIFIIKKGIKETAMVGWENSLKDTEILAVYAYINSLKKNDESESSDDHHEHNH